MKHEHGVQVANTIALNRFGHEYNDLLASSSTFSLQDLFTPDQFNLDEYCKDFYAHPQAEELKIAAEDFGRHYGIWLENAKYHITCALFLYPSAHVDRMLTMMEILTIGFYLNDVMGRDKFALLSAREQQEGRELIEELTSIDDTLAVSPSAHPIVRANAEALASLKQGSPDSWFKDFLKYYNYHILITHRDNNTAALGDTPGMEKYIEDRLHLGGVYYILKLIEYSDNNFLNWEQLKSIGLYNSMTRLHYSVAAFAGLSNDLFSFEKEVIDCCSDSNLVAITMLNNPHLSLAEAILYTSTIVRGLLSDCIKIIGKIKGAIKKYSIGMPDLANLLTLHIRGIERCLQAIWMWHVFSKRYKRPHSIFKETSFPGEMARKSA